MRLYTGEDGQSHFEDVAFPWARDARGREQTGPLPAEGKGAGVRSQKAGRFSTVGSILRGMS